jgi:hypothetical protein
MSFVCHRIGRARHRRERDLCPAPVDLSEEMLNELGDTMLERMSKLRGSTLEKLHVKGRAAMLRAM